MGDVTTQISELADLEDRIDLLEEMIQELLTQKFSKGELEVQLNQYVLLEDSIQTGVECLMRNVKTVQDKKSLDSSSDRFNKINSDFQENWNDEFWRSYNLIKGGKKNNKENKQDIKARVEHLKQIADTLNKSINDDKKEETNPEENENREIEPEKKNDPDPVHRKCCNCSIF